MAHRWSGWPGAWCLDCGIDDPSEECLALNYPECRAVSADSTGYPDSSKCLLHGTGSTSDKTCPEPNSNRHNPYKEPKNE